MMKLSDIARLFGPPAQQFQYSADTSIVGVCIDSRQVQPGHLFVAIHGESFDGHDFIAQAVSQGAIGVVCSRDIADIDAPLWIVTDTIAALAAMASFHRGQHACPVIALTGSNGKTTVKDMIAAILPKPSLATRGNFNNHIGVPLSVLALRPESRYAVFELGANHLGEIAHCVAIVKPQVTLINNIAPAHIEGFGSIEGVANAKGEIHQGLAVGGTAVINDDDAYAHYWDAHFADKKTLRFSITAPVDVHANSLTFNADGCGCFRLVTPSGEAWVELKVPGKHNVSNALAAAACTTALNISVSDIAAALSAFGGVAGRMTYRPGKHNALIIDDSYNANLRSTLAALEVLAHRKGRRIFVFGDMGELGGASQQHHHEVGLAARFHGIDMLLTCGTQSQWATSAFGDAAQHYVAQDNLIHDLLTRLDDNTTVLVKGSRSSAMEYVVHHLLAEANIGE